MTSNLNYATGGLNGLRYYEKDYTKRTNKGDPREISGTS